MGLEISEPDSTCNLALVQLVTVEDEEMMPRRGIRQEVRSEADEPASGDAVLRQSSSVGALRISSISPFVARVFHYPDDASSRHFEDRDLSNGSSMPPWLVALEDD